MAEARGVRLAAGNGFPRLCVDPGRLELVLVNLVANAIKYSDPEKAERFVEIAATVQDKVHEIRVRDNGLGIPANATRRIFHRFRREHQNLDATLGIDGTGLGLAIVDECVKSLGADIRVESEQGVGTTFILLLPEPLTANTGSSAAIPDVE
jgi:two-component system, OmpR family, sensor kinase